MAYKITLSAKEAEELRERIKKEKQVKIHRRLKCIEYKSKGATSLDIANILGVTNDTITDWVKLFTNKGFNGLCKLNYEGRRMSKLEPIKDEIVKYLSLIHI